MIKHNSSQDETRRQARIPRARRALAFLSALAVSCGLSGALASGASAYIYVSDTKTNTIDRATVDGQKVQYGFIQGASNPGQVVVDANHLYWLNRGDGSIGRANLDGSGANPDFIPNAFGTGSGLAVDGSHLYWTNWQSNVGYIGKANLDGTQPNPQWISDASTVPPGGVAVDGTYVYWTDLAYRGTACCEAYIGRAALDSSSATARYIDTGENVSMYTTAYPGGGQLVTQAGYLYWAQGPAPAGLQAGSTDIYKANVNGTQLNTAFGPTSADNPGASLAADASHVYWTNIYRYGPLENEYYVGSVDRSNPDGTNFLNPFFTTNAYITGLAVDALAPPAAGWPAAAPNPQPAPGPSPQPTPQPTPQSMPRCVVPKIVGKKLARARGMLVQAHCRVGKITRRHKRHRRQGTVLGTKPGAGKVLPANTKVSLTVAR